MRTNLPITNPATGSLLDPDNVGNAEIVRGELVAAIRDVHWWSVRPDVIRQVAAVLRDAGVIHEEVQ